MCAWLPPGFQCVRPPRYTTRTSPRGPFRTDQRQGRAVTVWGAKPTHTGVGQCVHDNWGCATPSRVAGGRQWKDAYIIQQKRSQFFVQLLESNERFPRVHQLTSGHRYGNTILTAMFCKTQQLLNRRPGYLDVYKHYNKSVLWQVIICQSRLRTI
jgi:hypothetical protein